MFDFNKLCNDVEKMSDLDRGVMIVAESLKIVTAFESFDLDYNPKNMLATFVLGAVISDGKIDEKEYILIYPSLVKAFGEDFDFESIKGILMGKEGKSVIKQYTSAIADLVSLYDPELLVDIVTLCLMIVSIDGKISLRERRYIRQLCK